MLVNTECFGCKKIFLKRSDRQYIKNYCSFSCRNGITGRTARFKSQYVLNSNGCHQWIGPINRGGYGKFFRTTSHRWAYINFVGEVKKGMQLDHLCRNRACCNTDHLEVVTARENTIRGNSLQGINSRKKFCNKGHEFNSENTIFKKSGNRECRQCRKDYDNAAPRREKRKLYKRLLRSINKKQ